MTSNIEYEPFIEDYNCSFHGIFTLFDISLNTGEIKPVHLALPRNRAQKKNPAASPVNSSGPRVVNPGDRPTANETPKPTRFLSSKYTSRTNGSGRLSGSTNKDQPNESASSPPEKNKNTNTSQPAENKPADKPLRRPGLSHQDNTAVTEMLLKIENYWMMPLSPSMFVRFIFTVIENPNSGTTFKLSLEKDRTTILTAKMQGTQRFSPMLIYFGENLIGETKVAQQNSGIYAGLTALRPPSEACAVVFNPSFSASNQPRMFDFLVPALKKIEGKSRMFPIQFSDTSGLVTKMAQMSKECIRMKTRIPVLNGKDYDMTYDGKFERSHMSNFVLFHDSNVRKDLCTFGICHDGKFELEVGYPMSPVQGFIAAIAATLPFT